MRVIIIEDEPIAAAKLQRQLQKARPDISIDAVLDSVEDGIRYLRQHQPDLVFLDIHLSDGLGFSIFDQVPPAAPVIFTTAYDQYAIKAFELNSVDYLLKPIAQSDLEAALEKFESSFGKPNTMPNLGELRAALLGKEQQHQKRFLVYTGEKIKSIQVEDTAYFFAESGEVLLVTKTNQQYILDYTLDKLEQVLDPSSFFRINRQFIIGIDAIGNMVQHTKGRVKIELQPNCSKESIVSVEKSARFKAWLNR